MSDLSKLGVSMADAEGYADRVKGTLGGAFGSLGLSRPSPTGLNAPVMYRFQLDQDTHEVWAVVRVDLGGGQLSELDVRKELPSATPDLEARYARLDSGVQELRVVDAEGVLYGLTVTAPQLREDDRG